MFFILSKVFWMVVQPLNALCLLAILGLLARIRWPDLGQRVMNTALILILIFGLMPIGPFAMTWLERQIPRPAQLPDKIDGIILLGGAFEAAQTVQAGHLMMNGQIGRAFCFADLAREHPEAKLVFSGGSGDILNPDAKESMVAKALFDMIGLNNHDIVYEDQSRNTYENAVFSKELVKPAENENWVLVTSAFHLPRSYGIFEKLGWTVIPYGCDPKTDGTYNFFRIPYANNNFFYLTITLKELIGSVVYYVTGKSAFILPPKPLPSPSS